MKRCTLIVEIHVVQKWFLFRYGFGKKIVRKILEKKLFDQIIQASENADFLFGLELPDYYYLLKIGAN